MPPTNSLIRRNRSAISSSFCFGSSGLYRLEGTHGLDPDRALWRYLVCELDVCFDAEPVFERCLNARHSKIAASMTRGEVHQNIEVAVAMIRPFDVGSKDVQALDAKAAQLLLARPYFSDQHL